MNQPTSWQKVYRIKLDDHSEEPGLGFKMMVLGNGQAEADSY